MARLKPRATLLKQTAYMDLLCSRLFDIVSSLRKGGTLYDYKFPEARITGYTLLSNTWRAIHRVLERGLVEVGITPEKAHVLWVCVQHPGVVTPAELGRILFRESESIAGLLGRMQREGLVTRVPKRKGHPFTEVRITAKGEELIHSATTLWASLAEGVISPLSEEEVEQLSTLLRKLLNNAIEELNIELKPWPHGDWRI